MLPCSMNKEEKTTPKCLPPGVGIPLHRNSSVVYKPQLTPRPKEWLQKAGGWSCRAHVVGTWGSDTWRGHTLKLVLLPAFWRVRQLPSKRTAPITPFPCHCLHTSGHSSRCVPFSKIKAVLIFTSVLPSHSHPQRTQIPPSGKLGSIGFKTKVQTPDYHLENHLI